MERIDKDPTSVVDQWARELARLDNIYGPVVETKYRVVEYVDSYENGDDVYVPARGVVARDEELFDTVEEAWEHAVFFKPSAYRGEIRVEKIIRREKFVPAHHEEHVSSVFIRKPTEPTSK